MARRAAVTDFVSYMGQLHWNPGIGELSHWETGQARMEVPFWEDPDAHRRDSPIHESIRMETPLLNGLGDEDGVVGLGPRGPSSSNFARRAGNRWWLLVYEWGGPRFRDEANREGLPPARHSSSGSGIT